MDNSTLKDWENLLKYYSAFQNSPYKQIKIADHCKIRPSTLSLIFSYLRKREQAPDAPPPNNLSKGTLIRVYNKLKAGFDIVAGELVMIGKAAHSINESNIIKIHEDYISANVADAIKGSGEEICILNTFLSPRMYHTQNAGNDPETFINWIEKQQKKIRLLLLRPDGKAMRLRTKTDLGKNMTNLTHDIIDGLETVLSLKQKYPDKIDIRLIDELPAMTCVILENRLFYGLHYATGHAEGGPTFEITDPTHFTYEKIKQHFETLWNLNRSQKLDEELLTQIKNAVQIVDNKLDYLMGQWDLFLHDISEVYKGVSAAHNNLVYADIDRFLLSIDKSERDIYPVATLSFNINGPEVLKGSLVTEALQGCDYAHIRFTDHVRLSIHVTIQCKTDNTLYGFFTLSSGKDSCTGVLILNKRVHTISKSADQIPEAWKRQLRFSNGAFMSLQTVRDNVAAFKEPFPYAGVYKVYSYGGKANESKNIKINWLYINQWGEAQYKNQHFNVNEKSGILHGRATEIHKNVHIIFTGFRYEKRRSYLIIHTNSMRSTTGRYYSAVHLGVSWDSHMPNGKRFLLERTEDLFENVEPKLISLHSDEYRALHASIRKLLTGRVKNLLGFLRRGGNIFTLKEIEEESNLSIKMEKIFQDSAIMLAKRAIINTDIKAVTDMLFRSVNHGLDSLDFFENEVQKLAPTVLEQLKQSDEYKKIQQTLRGDLTK
ncbi:MAG: hypothetical protein JNM22_07625 [Saprospiraceae bacterium]|nr:hypothetical protein [Saprospiraceae bacterium]